MHDEVPAAFPLIAYVAGLVAARSLVNPMTCLALLCVGAILLARVSRPRLAIAAALIALGLAIGILQQSTHQTESGHFFRLERDTFAMVDAPLDRDWMRRGSASVLVVPRFTMNGASVEQPLRIYARFDPSPIGMHDNVHAEGFIRQNERGRFTLSIKSPRLIRYSGRLSMLDPERWNRAATARVRKFADRYPIEVALIEALALGRGESLSAETRESFRRGGTYHLLVFSGLQIAFAAGVIAALLRFLDAPRLSDWSLLLFAVIAPMFIGPTASVSRASLGIALYALSRIVRRPTSLANLWCVSALLRLIAVPGDLTDVAFQLTYAGAAALIFIGKPLSRTRVRWVAYAIAAELAITPLTLFHFHQYALGGSLLTIAMTPIIFAMLVLSAAFCVVTFEPLLLALRMLNIVCGIMNDASATFSGFAAAPPAIVLTTSFALAMIALPFARARWRTAVMMAALAIPSATTIIIGYRLRSVSTPRVSVLDVGQGDSILARTGKRTMLVDAGGRHDDPRFGESTLIPMLVDRGVRRIDIAALTHAHPDHCGGLASVITHLDVGELWISPRRFRGPCAQEVLEASRRARVPIKLIRAPFATSVENFQIHVWPASRRFKRAPENNSSLVMRLEVDGRRMLLTGDIEHERELILGGEDLRADILKVAHHGSRSSSTPDFLDQVQPLVAAISCGARNLFHHPHPLVLQELRSRRIRALRTDVAGTIDIEFTRGHIVVRREIDTPQHPAVE